MQQSVDQFRATFTVQGYECDVNGNFLPGSVLRRVQQIGTDHCTLLGLTEAVYANAHTAFLLAKLGLEIFEAAHEGEEVEIITRPSGAKRAVYTRYTEFRNKQTQALLCAVDARWVLISTDTWRILRQPPEALPLPFAATDVPQMELTIEKATETQPLETQCATYTRCDQYRHMNNTHYADIVCDSLPLEELCTHGVKRMLLSYHNEVPLGGKFCIYRGKTARGSYYVSGNGESKLHFEAEVFC